MTAAITRERTCAGCLYAQALPLNQGLQCRGAPPSVVLTIQQTIQGPQPVATSVFPAVAEDMSCGQWAPRPLDLRSKTS